MKQRQQPDMARNLWIEHVFCTANEADSPEEPHSDTDAPHNVDNQDRYNLARKKEAAFGPQGDEKDEVAQIA
ncbi:MAG: hypothetical protein JRE23_03925 [Deltaproteobacteria bacterium]|nr:hypothetical protein [Deltaproteobacteria bacterium]